MSSPTALSPTRPAPKRQAFTLIELLVSIAIFSILSVTLAQFLSSFLLMKFNAETRLRMRQEGNYALDRIEFLVRNSVTQPKCFSDGKIYFNYQITSDQAPLRAQVRLLGSGDSAALVFCDYKVAGCDKHSYTCDTFKCDAVGKDGVTTLSSSSGSQFFWVDNYSVTCGADTSFGGSDVGYVVTIKFDLRYTRKVLSGDNQPLVEHFEREVAVRNQNTFVP